MKVVPSSPFGVYAYEYYTKQGQLLINYLGIGALTVAYHPAASRAYESSMFM